MRIQRSIPLLAAWWLAIPALLACAEEFSAVEHQRKTIYHSPPVATTPMASPTSPS